VRDSRFNEEVPWKPNWVWVRLYTDSGLVGLGEPYPRDIERIWADLYRTFDFNERGADLTCSTAEVFESFPQISG